ncbi:DUF4012 domain-containing protein, partial [Dehalococcoidia bacterium]|nr:DUF4012 domain-containing protein [Dehalococcoidia bacterium]
MSPKQPDILNGKQELRKWYGLAWHKIAGIAQTHPIRFWGTITILGITLALGALLLNTFRIATSIERDISGIMESINERELQELTSPQAYASLVGQIKEVETRIDTLSQRAAILRVFESVPGIGHRIGNASLFLDITTSFTRGTRLTLEGYSTTANAIGFVPSQADMLAIRQSLISARPLFTNAQQEFDRVSELRSKLKAPLNLGSRTTIAIDLMDQFVPLVELAIVIAKDTPQLVGEILQLRNSVSSLRKTVTGPAGFLEHPQELQEVFKEMQEGAINIQSNLIQVRAAVAEKDPRVMRVVDTATQFSLLLAGLGEGLGRFTSTRDRMFTLGPLSPKAAALLGKELPEIRGIIQAAQHELKQLEELMSTDHSDDKSSSILKLATVALGTSALPIQREESLLAVGLKTVDFLTAFLGYDRPKTYLLIGQNDDEIRATGGFIGVVAELTLEKGELTGLRYLDSTTVDAPPYSVNPMPPAPIYKYLWMAKLLFRDSNWNPHFPASAAQISDLYQRNQNVKVDGVIAATEEVILDLVDVFGDIKVPEISTVLSRTLAEQYVEGELPYQCLPRHISGKGKRCFDEDLFQEVLDRLLSDIPPETRGNVIQTFLDRLRNKDLLVHVFDTKAAELLWEQGWNGALRQVDHDYLMIVDSSLPGHARSAVERRVQYHVTLAMGQPIDAELLIQYRHKGQVLDPNCRQALSQPTGCYWNYLRVYIPVIAQDIQVPPIPMHEGSQWLLWGYEPAD